MNQIDTIAPRSAASTQHDNSAQPAAPPSAPAAEWRSSTRYADQPMSLGTRLFGIGGVSMIALLIVGGSLFTWRTYTAAPAPAALSVFDVTPPAAPPEPVSEVPPGPEVVEKPMPDVAMPQIELPEIQLRNDNPISLPTPRQIPDPGPPIERTTAPEAKPLPPAPQVSTGQPTWEGLVLGALNQVKRYPVYAQSRRQQGVPWIRVVIDREGRVLSVRLERSSGFRSLDDEAVKLPGRAQPLPKPPTEVQGTTIEIVVPVEFFMQ